MNLYPAIQASMGSWTYYVIRMTMRDAAKDVQFAHKVWDNHTLDEAIQRVLEKGRVQKEIVQYLTRQEHRFFSAIVVAALEGNPHWIPLEISDVPSMQIFAGYAPLGDTFGVLRFDGRQKYYALDGQHRLAAIKTLMDPNSEAWRQKPAGFGDEEIAVIVVVPSEGESEANFLKRYRRLFGNLNRYAKPTDAVTNIIMDEDDLFAILTRRLITDHEFFRSPVEDQQESPRIKTKKGKNLRAGDSFFTSLETLYAMNRTLLASRLRKNGEWSKLKMFVRFRPQDDEVDSYFEELAIYWDTLIELLPDLREDPPGMRLHGTEGSDSALFWPIGQELLAELARDLLDDGASRGIESPKESLRPVASISWELHTPPWRNLVLVPGLRDEAWRIRSEDRKPSINLAKEILWFQTRLAPLSEEGLQDLQSRWRHLLLPALEEEDVDILWREIMNGVVPEW